MEFHGHSFPAVFVVRQASPDITLPCNSSTGYRDQSVLLLNPFNARRKRLGTFHLTSQALARFDYSPPPTLSVKSLPSFGFAEHFSQVQVYSALIFVLADNIYFLFAMFPHITNADAVSLNEDIPQ